MCIYEIYIHVDTYVDTCICIYVYVHIRMHLYIYICISLSLFVFCVVLRVVFIGFSESVSSGFWLEKGQLACGVGQATPRRARGEASPDAFAQGPEFQRPKMQVAAHSACGI